MIEHSYYYVQLKFNKGNIMDAILLLLLVIAFILGGPFVTIWALNTLFTLGIPFTFWTWLSVAWIQGIVLGTIKYRPQK